MPVPSPIQNRLYKRFGGDEDPYARQEADTPPPPVAAAPGTPAAAPPPVSAPQAAPAQPQGSAQDFIRQYQASHPISASSMDDLTGALSGAGYTNASRYMYGSTPSGNELNVDGQKYKVRVDGGGWYTGGDDSAPGGGGAAGPQTSAFQQQIRDLLMQQLGTLSKPVTGDDPAIAGEMAAQGRVLERTRQERRAASAERAAASGMLNGGQGSGAFDADIASGYEDKGNQLTGIQAQLFGREIQSRRDKVAQLLNMAMQSGDSESARALQMQMAQMDDQMKRLGLAQNKSQWDDSFGLDAAKFGYGKDRDAFIYGTGA